MKHCLVVEDSRVIRTVARGILEGFDFQTIEAEDGIAALKACRAKMPELILLDWNLPNSSGTEFMRSLRREPDGARPIVIFCTTENDVGEINEAMAAGANDYILKPYDRDTIREKLTDVGLI